MIRSKAKLGTMCEERAIRAVEDGNWRKTQDERFCNKFLYRAWTHCSNENCLGDL